MSDPTVEALGKIKAHAAQQGTIVDRVEVFLRDQDGRTSVEFTEHLSPKPLQQATVCIGYTVDGQ